MHACRAASKLALGFNSPGSLAFGHDMFMDTPLIADVMAVNRNRQLLVDRRLLRENAKRILHDYAVGGEVWKKMYLGHSDKLLPTVEGPYRIEQVYTNGTVLIRLRPNLVERINIRRLRPRYRPRQPVAALPAMPVPDAP